MSQFYRQTPYASGQTGNNTHAGFEVPPDIDKLVLRFIIEAVGATPTVTYKWQYSFDGPDVADASSKWYDHEYVTVASGLGTAGPEAFSVATETQTAVGIYEHVNPSSHLANRRARKFRLVTSANTNVTYRAELLGIDQD